MAFAQDEGQSAAEIHDLNSHPELNLNEDKTLLIETDARAAKSQPGNREGNNQTLIGNKNKADAQKAPATKTEEDPLSFNFLYFIIEKFKISDIIDD